MAEELKKEFGLDAKLIAGKGGVFDVIADGRLIFSKFRTGHFPDPGEVTKKLKG